MMTVFNPLKAFHTRWFAETSQAPTKHLRELDTSYRGRAIVSDAIEPCRSGRVRFQDSWWPARCEQDITLNPGDIVQVIGRQNITLFVKPSPRRSHSL